MRRFLREVTAATAFGLSVVMAAAAGPAHSATRGPDAAVRGRPCVNVGGASAAAVIRKAEECSHWAGPAIVSTSAGPVSAAAGPASTTADPLPNGGPQRQHQSPGRQALANPGRRICGPPYVDGDPRLGPLYLPRTGYFGTLLFGYHRYGTLTPSQFLAKYWNPTKTPPDWNYPPDGGFARNSQNQLLRFRVTLYPGQYVDRFGNEMGSFLATGGSSFISRAIPPNSLNTSPDDPAHLCNYHLYRVVTAFDVDGGPAAAWFEQPGGACSTNSTPLT